MNFKESDYKNDFEIHYYDASIKEMKDFKNLIRMLEEKYKELGAVKIRIPKGHKFSPEKVDENTRLTEVITLKPNRIDAEIGHVYEMTTSKKESMSYHKYRDSDDLISKATIEEKENHIWEKLSKNENTQPYAVDVELSSFPNNTKIINFNNFTKTESLIHTKKSEYLIGVHKPYSCIGRFNTLFAYHVEDFYVCAINFLHLGNEKIWYIIPYTEIEKLEKLAKIFGEKDNVKCDLFLRHRSLMIPPSVLRKNNIRFSRVIQRKNEYVVVFPGAYHSGFNCGFNLSESINFSSDFSLNLFPNYKLCHCPDINDGANVIKNFLAKVYGDEIEKQDKENNKPFSCDTCKISFSLKKNLQRHMLKHKDTIVYYECPKCKSLFTRPCDVKTHMKNSTRCNIKISQKIKTVEKPNKNQNNINKTKNIRTLKGCPYCEKSFTGTFNLRRHVEKCYPKK